MNVQDIIWLADVEEKIIHKHRVKTDEVEQVLQTNCHVRFMERGQRTGEDLYVAFGQTTSDCTEKTFSHHKGHKGHEVY